MAQLYVANQLATDLNIDKIIQKLKYNLVGLGIFQVH
jgi:hypothetical protein